MKVYIVRHATEEKWLIVVRASEGRACADWVNSRRFATFFGDNASARFACQSSETVEEFETERESPKESTTTPAR